MFYKQFISLCHKEGIKPTPLIKSLGLSAGNIKRWEDGATVNSDILLKLSEHFKVSTDYLLTGKEKSPPSDLADDEQLLMKYYRKLSSLQKGIIIGRSEALAGVELINTTVYGQKSNTIYIDMFSLPVSAGSGVYLDSSDKHMIEVESNCLTQQANFALTISGDSMQPKYCDGDVVLIESQPSVDIGEIGIFIYENEGYIKKFGGDKLISLNPKYPDILIKDIDSFYCKGKVIGKL